MAGEEVKTARIPLIGWTNARAGATNPSADQLFTNCMIFTSDQRSGNKTYLHKRPGIVGASSSAATKYNSGFQSAFATFAANANGTSYEIKKDGTKIHDSVVTADYRIARVQNSGIRFCEGEYRGESTAFWIAYNASGVGQEAWYWPEASGTVATGTFTADTNSSTSLTNLSSIQGTLYVGMKVTGTDIPADTYITALPTATTATISNAATGTTVGVTVTRTAAARVRDSDFPIATAVGRPVYMDGYFFVITTDGKLYNSDLNDITTWAATSYIQVDGTGGHFHGLERWKNYIVAFSSYGIYFFKNVGNATGSPLAREEGMPISMGVTSSYGLIVLGDVIYFLGRQSSGQTSSGVITLTTQNYSTGLYYLDGVTPTLIPDPQGANKVSSDGPWWSLKGWIYQGKKLLFVKHAPGIVSGSSDTIYWVYDDTVKFWSQWKWSNANAGGALVGETGQLLGLEYRATNGVYLSSTTGSADGNDAFAWQVRTSKVDFDTNKRKRFHKLTLVGDLETSTTSISVSWSDDDYTNYSSARTIDLSSTTNNYLRVLGAARRRGFLLSNTSSVDFRLEAIEIEYSELSK